MKNNWLQQAFCKLQQLIDLIAKDKEMHYLSFRAPGCTLTSIAKCSTRRFLTPVDLGYKLNKKRTKLKKKEVLY